SNGLNASQYVVLYAAKFGSAFATNGWKLFNETLADNRLIAAEKLVSEPNVPEIGGILQFMYVVSTCAELELMKNGRWIDAYVVKDPLATQPNLLFADLNTGGGASYERIIDFID